MKRILYFLFLIFISDIKAATVVKPWYETTTPVQPLDLREAELMQYRIQEQRYGHDVRFLLRWRIEQGNSFDGAKNYFNSLFQGSHFSPQQICNNIANFIGQIYQTMTYIP